MADEPKISVIGLGYVGLPLAVALAERFDVVGYDRSEGRIAELSEGRDATRSVGSKELGGSSMLLTGDPDAMVGSDLFIIAVPTPVDADNQPDLSAVVDACRTIGSVLGKGAVVVLESTVYPGVTEDVCGPELAGASGLVAGVDFQLGYSPERMNPGDRAHGIDAITKVIAGQTPAVVELMTAVYGAVAGDNLFVAADIRTAEAAKVIENAQRDLNVAFVNEVAMIFDKMGLSTADVLAAARTKWNFLDFHPGLVGGHCIGVDPYYLAVAAEAAGHRPDIILAGRRINEGMAGYVAGRVLAELAVAAKEARILVLGLTFKENVPDLRNTKVAKLVAELRAAEADVVVCDPMADPEEARRLFGIDLVSTLDGLSAFDAVVGAVAHDEFRVLSADTMKRLIKPGGLVADIKGMWRGDVIPGGVRRWAL
jgi:UDP-N-acetyl-D-galactosamine dehydrogenase